MRSAFFAMLLAVAGLLCFAAPDARAQFVTPYYGPAYNPYAYYYPPVYSYYSAPPPYYWYGNYYNGPYYRGYYYNAYSPYTNQYFYQYRTYPRHWVRW